MKENPNGNRQDLADAGIFDVKKSTFIRRGEVGNWKEYFTEEQVKYVDDIYKEKSEPIEQRFQDIL